MERSADTAVAVAWLHYVAGLTQAEIAKQRGLSKATVHRLLRSAHESGAVRVFVGERPSKAVELEQEMIAKFGLQSCRLVPPDIAEPEDVLKGVATLAVQSLMAQLETGGDIVVGLGAGRTLSAMARDFPRLQHSKAEFVTLTGDFSVFKLGHSTDVLRRLADRTGGTGYSIAAPILADSEADRAVLMSQKGSQIAFGKITEARATFSGIGDLGEGSFFTAFNLITPDELKELSRSGVTADFCGNLINADGAIVDHPLGRRMVACDLAALKPKRNTALAFGLGKVQAIHAVLKTGLLTELISDSKTADALLSRD